MYINVKCFILESLISSALPYVVSCEYLPDSAARIILAFISIADSTEKRILPETSNVLKELIANMLQKNPKESIQIDEITFA